MSKIYEKYLALKNKDKNKLYLFRNGNFYIFLKDDCDYINEYVVLKKTLFAKDVYKCGFPVCSKEQYMHVFNNHNLNIEIIENYEDINCNSYKNDDIINMIKNINLNDLTPIQAMNFLFELKEKINERSWRFNYI